MDEWDTKLSEWNEAKAYLMRIDECLRYCNLYKRNDDFKNWYRNLEALHDEISARMQVKFGINKENEVEITDKLRIVARNLSNSSAQINAWIVRDALRSYEHYLREIMRRRKMDLPTKQDPSGALLQ